MTAQFLAQISGPLQTPLSEHIGGGVARDFSNKSTGSGPQEELETSFHPRNITPFVINPMGSPNYDLEVVAR